MSEVFIHERPSWCPHQACQFRTCAAQQSLCIGELAAAEPHDDGFNTHRLCIHGARDDGEWTFDLQINNTDVFWLRTALNRVFPLPKPNHTPAEKAPQ